MSRRDGSHSDDQPLELSIVVPTFCERDNVSELVRRLDACLKEHRWEVLFVDDDSPDGTANVVRDLAQRDPRIRCLRRIGRRGLSTACIEGMLASAAPVIAIMDGDLQHDETRLPTMLRAIRDAHADLVVGTRYAEGGSLGGWDASRATMSRFRGPRRTNTSSAQNARSTSTGSR